MQIHTPTVVQGRGGGTVDGNPLVRVFYMLHYFETIFPSVESLWSSLQDEVYFMGGGEGWKNSYWKHHVLMFYPVGENDVFFVRYAIKIDIRPCPVSIFSDPVLSNNL